MSEEILKLIYSQTSPFFVVSLKVTPFVYNVIFPLIIIHEQVEY